MNDKIPEEFSLENMTELDEDAIFKLIHNRVIQLMDEDVDLLMSFLYRLDIKESSLQIAIQGSSDESLSVSLAQLILNRQKERIETKKKFPQPPIEGWDY